jgi:hypothetical protein
MSDASWWWIVAAFWIVGGIVVWIFNHGAHRDDSEDDSNGE